MEVFKSFNKQFVRSLILTGIAYIYVGLVWQNLPNLLVVGLFVIAFMVLSYYRFVKNYIFIVIGLISHGLWDLNFPHFLSSVPKGYGVFLYYCRLDIGFLFL